jgi:large subunit ribosomal protein L32
MGVPRAHSTRGQKGRRRSHLALKKIALVSCAHCSKLKSAHEVCKYCGYYNGKEVINVISKELKKKEKQLKAQKK